MSDKKFIKQQEHHTESPHLQELHLRLQDSLAGYVDGELTHHELEVIEAHLAGCAACRADVERQQVISHQLQKLTVTSIPLELDKRIDNALENQAPPRQNTPSPLKKLWAACTRLAGAKQVGWIIAAVMALIIMQPHLRTGTPSKIPMIEEAVSQYNQIENSTLPLLPVNNKVVMPIKISGAQLLATWTTNIGGDPAQAFAVRVGHNVIIQYRISQTVFFRSASVRKAVSNTGDFRMKQDHLEIVAMPINQAGLLMVGPVNTIPNAKAISDNTL